MNAIIATISGFLTLGIIVSTLAFGIPMWSVWQQQKAQIEL